ncbi:uncharacterized protein DS421_16g540970 [Arachis hypogaea]|nr:uncharacterized protein DS421_16g540970 [Arachis hypogaea]
MEKDQAHRHVLVNCEAVVLFLEVETKRRLRTQTRSQCKIDRVVHAKFSRWFKHEVPIDSTLYSKEIKLLACGPMPQARRFEAYNVNGCHFTVVLSKCIWVDTTTSRGIKQDHLCLTSVNFTRPIHTGDRKEDEPYILASEAHLVYYVHDEVDKDWSVVVYVKPRDLYDMGRENEEVEAAFSPQSGLNMLATGDIGDLRLTRHDDIKDPIDDVFDSIDDVV